MSDQTIASQDAAKVVACTSQCMHHLLKLGLTLQDAQAVINDPKLRERVMMFWKNQGTMPGMELTVVETESQKQAREIFGSNFLGLPEVFKYFSTVFTEEQVNALARLPFSREQLESLKETHVLVADLGLSILQVCARENNYDLFMDGVYFDEFGGACLFDGDEDEDSVREERSPTWRLIRKKRHPKSILERGGLSFEAKKSLLDFSECASTVGAIVYGMVLFFLKQNEKLFQDPVSTGTIVTRNCSDSPQHIIACWGDTGIYFQREHDNEEWEGLGLASEIIPDFCE